ncbi:hypothetical protein [Nostoc sp.]|uniref:hypothetical protein n=1 Tax=Nostoc sp. TaxID=1180 RepID=UPI002FFD00DB
MSQRVYATMAKSSQVKLKATFGIFECGAEYVSCAILTPEGILICIVVGSYLL